MSRMVVNALSLLLAVRSSSSPSSRGRDDARRHSAHPPRCHDGSAIASPPHLIVIMVDDLGREDVGYRGSLVQTPHIDALASEAVHVEHFVSYSWCAPSRMAFMTGREPHIDLKASTFEVRQQEELCCGRAPVLPPTTTLPAMLRAAGYRTSLVGKLHFPEQACFASTYPGNQLRGKRRAPDSRKLGWDSFVGFYGGTSSHWDREAWVLEDGSPALDPGKGTVHTTDYITEAAVGVIASHAKKKEEQPLFLWASYTAPHTPHQAPRKLAEKYAALVNRTSLEGQVGMLGSLNMYLAMIEQVDTGVGNIVAALERQGMRRDALLVFLSDNGGVFAPPFCNGALRGGKGLGYEGGVRVPFFVTWPTCLGGRRDITDRVLRIEDLFSTLLSLTFHGDDEDLGVNATASTPLSASWGRWLEKLSLVSPHSRPFFNVLSGTQKVRHGGQLNVENDGVVESAGLLHAEDRRVRWLELGSHSFAVQRGRYKLVQSLAVWAAEKDLYPRVKMRPEPKVTRFLELFDLASDPFERVNILARIAEPAPLLTSVAEGEGPLRQYSSGPSDRRALEALWALVMRGNHPLGLGVHEKALVPQRGWWYQQVLLCHGPNRGRGSAARLEQAAVVCAASHAHKDRESWRRTVLFGDGTSDLPPGATKSPGSAAATLAICQNRTRKTEVPLFGSGWCFAF